MSLHSAERQPRPKARTGIKKSITRPSHTDIYPPDPIAASAADNSGVVGAESHQDLAELAWKYFAEEIGETLREVQQALAPEKG